MDCLFVGHNDGDFAESQKLIEEMGTQSGAYKDLNLAFFEYNNKPYRAMDVFNCFNEQDKGVFYNGDYLSLTIAYLASFVASNGYDFGYVNTFHLEKEKLKNKLMKNDILAIIIPTTFYVAMQPLYEVVQFVKKYNQTAKIIIGGPFIYNQTFQNSNRLNIIYEYLDADFYVCSAEGETALVNILKALKSNLRYDNINNIIYKRDYTYVTNKMVEEDNNLTQNAINWKLFDKENIGNVLTIRTAKSCPFSCAFCGFPLRAGQYKYISVQDVEKEFDNIKNLNTVTALNIIDDTFNVPIDRFKEILRMMIRNKYNFKWNSFFRCQFADEETIALMKESGCEGVYLGIESGSNKILKNMNKTATREQYIKGLELLNKYNIISYASFIIGFPGETDETVQETISFIKEAKPTFFRTQLWYCDRITPIYKQKDKYKISGCNFQWKHETMTSEQACNWIDYIFLNTKDSIWTPQDSFDYLGIYYLLRKGMTLEQVKEFVISFNEIIKHKLRNPKKISIDGKLVEQLKEKCRF